MLWPNKVIEGGNQFMDVKEAFSLIKESKEENYAF